MLAAIIFTATMSLIWPMLLPPLISFIAIFVLTFGSPAAHQALPLIVVFGLTMPAAAYLAGVLLDQFALSKFDGRVFQTFLLVLVYGLIVNGNTIAGVVEVVVAWQNSHSAFGVLPILIMVIGKLLFCAAAATSIVIGVHIAFELPSQWLLRGENCLGLASIATLRPLGVVFLLAIGMQLLSSLWLSELSLKSLLSQIGN